MWISLDGFTAHQGLLVLSMAVLWDLALGEPPARFHPVVWMGRVIRTLDLRARRGSPADELLQGAIIALVVTGLFAGGAALLLRWPDALWLRLGLGAWLLKASFAQRALDQAAMAVARALAAGDLPAARTGLRSLCSRDPSALGPEAVAAGAVESVAENTSDSVVAPLLFFALFGVPGAIAYRAVNTMDAMIGYHGRYEYLGKAAARFDDLLNLIPARLTAALLLLAGLVHGHDARRGIAVLRRDGARTESPNAGRPMAVMAGLLGVVLEKDGHYCLGEGRLPDAGAITAACRVARTAGALACVLAGLLTSTMVLRG